ncbi:MAG: type III-A CRISPR-associated RAMP protein Csm5, partial [Thermodesulfovibrionales bacterium]|nr:type III-A CRISPR-associated RAMP protein Csm5 [Thermodesulfovibrionales bacterium]
RITRLEFIHEGQYVYPVSEDRLSLLLHKKNLISDYVSAIKQEEKRFNLAEFLKSRSVKLTNEVLEDLSGKRKIKVLSDASRMQEFRPMIRDGFGIPYIPGTSIKGVIRTALLYNALKSLKDSNPADFKSIIEDRIKTDIHNRVDKRKLFEWAEEKWLAGYRLDDKKGSPNRDWLRMLHVTDAYCPAEIETVLIEVNILKKEHTWTYRTESSLSKTAIWLECLPENTVLEFEASWDKRLLEEFKRYNRRLDLPDNLNKIFAQLKNWSEDIFAFERNFSRGHDLERWYINNPSTFRVGFGSGMISTTIVMLLEEDTRKTVRNYAGLNRGKDIAPKSRRVWIKNNIPVPLGWAVIEVVGSGSKL